MLVFPRRGRLAGAETHDRAFPAHRLARLQCHVLDDAVALVEKPKHRDALRHRRDAALPGRRDRRTVLPRRRLGLLLALRLLPARGERKRDQQRCGARNHNYSGIQGS
ncbi:MAG TPA: hypothetical protein VIL42_08630 [Sphingomicrobium sp.]